MKLPFLMLKRVSFILASIILLTSCGSTTLISSEPSGAKLYIDGEPMGTTPYSYRDKKIVGSTTSLRFEKAGYESLDVSLTRDEEVDVGAIIGGIFVLVPFLWIMKYKPTHTYELTEAMEITEFNEIQNNTSLEIMPKKKISERSKAERLRELKELLDENILTQEEYDQQKKKILDEE